MQVISLASRIVLTIGIKIKERRKWDRDTLLNMKKYEASDLILVNVKNIKDPYGAYYCYCAYVLRISRYSDFLSAVLINTARFKTMWREQNLASAENWG